MPLILFTGLPSSGKSTRANSLVKFLNSKSLKTSLISANSSLSNKNQNADILSRVNSTLDPQTYVILDYSNHIKGFRYQLHCLSKQLKTSYSLIYCAISIDDAKSRCGGGPDFEDMVAKYEEPDTKNKWENPLFLVLSSDDDSFHEQLLSSLDKKVLQPNASTVDKVIVDPDHVSRMDKCCKQVCLFVTSMQKDGNVGRVFYRPSLELFIPEKFITVGEMLRTRNQFFKINRVTVVDGDENVITAAFCAYFNSIFA